jgi:CheY-like chemotaxis protein
MKKILIVEDVELNVDLLRQLLEADPITYYSQLAQHWQQAEDSTQAIYYLEKAGEQARQKGDFERAMQLYNEALRLEAETAV